MTRKLVLLCATLVALASGPVYGLGLGELELHSALNQRFDAEIKLTSVEGLEPEEILPSLASPEDFERVGVERSFVLTDLRFKVTADENGDPIIKVTSTKPIIEPYLNFIVEVLWPSGRILREYTVLLDPPTFAEKGVEPLKAPETAQTSQPEPAASPPKEQAQPSAPAARPQQRTRPEPMAEEGEYKGGEYGMTGPGDTLWAIALKVRPDNSVSVQQTMLAIKRANPDAFINDNINLLKAGYNLKIPDLRDIRRQTRRDAIAQVQTQNDEFQRYKSGASLAQLDASRRQKSGAASEQQESGELKIVTSGDQQGEKSGSGGGSNAKVSELQSDLAVAKEDLDKARRDKADLASDVDSLQSQVDDLNALIEAKDNQLAALKQQLQKTMEQQAQAPAPPPARAGSSSLLTNPFVLGGLGFILLVGGVAGGMIFVRNRQQSTALDDEDFPAMTGEGEVADTANQDEAEAETAEITADDIDEELAPQTSDAISEAEIYIAYGRFPQAITFLQNAIDAEPDRSDLRLKLLEVFVQTEDATAFNLEFEKLKEMGDEQAIARANELQQQIPGAAETAEAAMDATVVSSEPVAPVQESDDDDDLSFDLDDLDSETEDEELDLGSDLDLDDETEDLDLDLDDDSVAQSDASMADNDDIVQRESEAGGDDTVQLESEAGGDDTVQLETSGAGGDDTVQLETSGADDDDDFDLDLNLDEDDDDALDLEDLDLGEDEDDALDLGDLDLGEEDTDDADDDALELSLDEDDSDAADFSLDEDDDTALDLTEDDDTDLSLDDDDDSADLNLDDDDGADLNLDDDDDTELNLDDDDDLQLDDDIDLNLDDDVELNLDEDDDALSLDDDLDLDEDASTKLDLARAYIDMGDNEGARNVLQEVIKEGTDNEVQEANELLEKID